MIGNTEMANFRNPTSKTLTFIYIQQVADKIQRHRIRAGLFAYYRGSSKFSLLEVLAAPEVIQLVQTRCSKLHQLYKDTALFPSTLLGSGSWNCSWASIKFSIFALKLPFNASACHTWQTLHKCRTTLGRVQITFQLHTPEKGRLRGQTRKKLQ